MNDLVKECDQSSRVDCFMRAKLELGSILVLSVEEGASLASWSTFSLCLIPE